MIEVYIEKDFPLEIETIAKREANSKKPVYQLHKWFARRVGSIFRMIILSTFAEDTISEKKIWQKFYQKNEKKDKIILDPFMGGGSTVIEGLRLGYKVIGIDLNPVAMFIVKKEVDRIDLKKLKDEFEEIKREIAEKIKNSYKTTCPRCENEADVMYVFWVKFLNCINCKKEISLFNSYKIAKIKENFIFICPKCEEIIISKDPKEIKICEHCNEEISLMGYNSSKGYYYCPHCGQKGKILSYIRQHQQKLNSRMFALEYYCRNCNQREYKKKTKQDRNLYEKFNIENLSKSQKSLIPSEKLLEGEKTREPLNHYYKNFKDFFNKRQLCCLTLLLERILKIEDKNIREFFLITFSDFLNANNMLCKYNSGARKLEPLYGHHAYWVPMMPVENNVWGAKYGRGTFIKYFKKLLKAKEYCLNPYEIKIQNEKAKKIFLQDKIVGRLTNNFESLSNGDFNLILKSQTSEDLSFIPNNSIDGIITDPPYYNNVMYSELSDFFYVWLKIGLEKDYEVFEAELSPKLREIVKSPALKKNDDFFLKGLTQIFKQCNRVLKKEGLMVFTFHHEQTKAWASTLGSILNAGFYILAVYPIHSEPRTGVHFGGIKYDTIIVCKKREEKTDSTSWELLKDQIYLNSKAILNKIWKSNRGISDIDILVITMGKALELYSKNYPNILKENKSISILDALKDIEDIIESLIKVRDLNIISSSVDELTRLFILHILDRKKISYDELNKILRTSGNDINLFFKEYLILKEEKSLKIALPKDRLDFIKNKIDKKYELFYIDKVHYLYNMYQMNKPITSLLKEWGDETLKEIFNILYLKTGVAVYQKIFGTIEVIPGHKKKIKKIFVKKITEFLGDKND